MSNFSYTPLTLKPRRPRWPRYLRAAGAIILGAAAAWGVGLLGGETFSIVRQGLSGSVITIGGKKDDTPKLPKIADDAEYQMPENDKNRLDILLLGVRGDGESANGGLLTDTIMLLSMDRSTGRAALVSIPRDLMVRISDTRTEKVNAAYVHNGVGGTKKLFSRILGVGIDNVVVIDFSAFQAVVDALGGVTVTLDKPFEESQQWAGESDYVFSLPAGANTLTGEQALYYVRSRYGTSDFDRSRRQQQVMLAIKNKVQGLNLMAEPIKALQLVTTVRKHIETDLDILDLGTVKELLAQGSELEKIRRYQLTTENLLYEAKINGIYELLPRDNTLAHLKRFFQTVLADTPVFPIPTDPSPGISTLSAPASASAAASPTP